MALISSLGKSLCNLAASRTQNCLVCFLCYPSRSFIAEDRTRCGCCGEFEAGGHECNEHIDGDVDNILGEVFRFEEFKKGQKEAIMSLLFGRDCIFMSATGSGKSLVYWLTPLVRNNGVGVVFTPFVAINNDQVCM